VEPGTLSNPSPTPACENFLYGFKGARSAPVTDRAVTPAVTLRETARHDGRHNGRRERTGGRKRPRDTHYRGTGSSALAPSGARRAAARSLPRTPPVTGRPPSRLPTAPARGMAVLSALRSWADQDHHQERSGLRPPRRTRWRCAPLWTVILLGSERAYL